MRFDSVCAPWDLEVGSCAKPDNTTGKCTTFSFAGCANSWNFFYDAQPFVDFKMIEAVSDEKVVQKRSNSVCFAQLFLGMGME